MPMTSAEQNELRNMLQRLSWSYSKAQKASEKAIPATRADKAAIRLINRLQVRREKYREKLQQRFDMLKQAAREAVYFSNDTKKALAAIKRAEDFL